MVSCAGGDWGTPSSPQGKVTFGPLLWSCIAVAMVLENWIGLLATMLVDFWMYVMLCSALLDDIRMVSCECQQVSYKYNY